MRPLTEDETRAVFEKLSKYIGENITHLIDRDDEEYCFRYHREKVYYMSEKVMRRTFSTSFKNLVCIGVCFGRFTRSRKFLLQITALEYIAPYAKHKVWVKPNSEQSFLYGNNIFKTGLGRITENTPKYQGVVVYSMNDVPLGFGVCAKSTTDCRRADPMAVVVFHQADVGEYIRSEAVLT